MKVSVTLLSAYEYCSRKLFMSRVLQVEEPPRAALVLGTIRHATFERINAEEERVVKGILRETTFEDLVNHYKKAFGEILRIIIRENKQQLAEVEVDIKDAFRSGWKSVLLEANERAKNTYEFMEKTKHLGDALWESLTPKLHSEVRIESSRLGLKGVIDQLREYQEYLEPVELKTGSAPQTGLWPSHRIQLAAYLMLLREEYKNSHTQGVVRYLDAASTRTLQLNPFMEEEVLSLRDKVQEVLTKGTLPERTKNVNKCASCPLREICYDDGRMEGLMASFSEKGKL